MQWTRQARPSEKLRTGPDKRVPPVGGLEVNRPKAGVPRTSETQPSANGLWVLTPRCRSC
jgi:hypothetical protein